MERLINAIRENASSRQELEQKVIDSHLKIRARDVLVSASNRRNDFFQREKYGESNEPIAYLIRERYNLMKTIVHAEELSNYYRRQLDRGFAVRKFRAKVRENAPMSEIRERRMHTVNTVNTEIKIMRERVIEYRDKVEVIDKKLETLLADRRVEKLSVTKTITEDEMEIRDDYEKCYLSKRRRSDRKTREEETEHLIIFI